MPKFMVEWKQKLYLDMAKFRVKKAGGISMMQKMKMLLRYSLK